MTRTGPWTLVLLFVFASLTMSAHPAQAQLEETGTIKGTVCSGDADCWNGLPDAKVTLTRTDGVLPHEQTATTGEGGSFYFDEVPHGSYELVASRAGFETGNTSLTVDGSESTHVLLEPREVSVDLRVEDADGKGLDAIVSWYGDRSDGATEVEAGDAVIQTLAGHHSLSIDAPGFVRSEQWLLLDGSDVRVEMHPVPPQDAAVVGTVRDQDGKPVQGAVVHVNQYGHDHEPRPLYAEDSDGDATASSPAREPYHRGGSNRTVTAADGSYRIHVWSGDVSLSVQKEGHAGRSAYLQVGSGDEHHHDVELPKYPDKTARVEGRVLGVDGKPLQNVHVTIWLPEYGVRECSSEAQAGGGSSGSPGEAEPEPAGDAISYPYPHRESCAITMDRDGSFSGNVTPGYAIVEAWHDHYRTCSGSEGSDGSVTRSCGPEYLGYARTLVLPGDETTQLTIQMKARPAADASVSGYVVDGETQQAIPGVQIHFSNEETYGWGSATTDGDGSYKVGARGGYHRVSVWADGYLPWQGFVQVPAGGDVSLDVVLTPGQTNDGYCCYAYDEVGYAESSDAPSMARGSDDKDRSSLSAGGTGATGGSSGEAVQDLGGGLGPYDAQKRSQQLQQSDNGAPGPAAIILALALLGAALVARRQR